MDPINYSGAFSPQDPMQSFTQGLQAGANMQQVQLNQQQQQYQMQRARQMQSMAAQVAQNPTPQSIAQLSIAFPEMSEQFKRSFDILQPAQQQARLQTTVPVYAAIQSGRPDLASQMLQDHATALENSGNTAEAQQTRAFADLIKNHPDQGGMTAGLLLASAMGPDKFAQTFKDVGAEQRAQGIYPSDLQTAQAKASEATTTALNAPQKQATDIANVQSQIQQRAGQLGLDRDKLMSDMQLKLRELGLQYGTPPDDTRKLINDSAMSAAAGEQSAARLNDLASRMDQVAAAGRANGNFSTAAEAVRQATGTQDGVSALKQEYARIVNNQALAGIKESLGGRVTDVDMNMAMGSVPGPNASPEAVTSYLRGAAKLQQLDAARQQAQAEWLSQVGRAGHLGPTKQDITVMGTQVPAGTTFADFSRQFLQQKADQIAAQSALVRAQGKSYMRHAQPQEGGQPAAAASAPTGAPGGY